MDLVDFDETVFDEIRSEYIAFTANLGIDDLQFIPISALRGDNVVEKSDEMPWYQGSTLMYLLENVQIASDRNFEDFRFAVQRVSRPDSSLPRLQRHGAERHRASGRSDRRCCLQEKPLPSRASSPWTAISRKRSRHSRSRLR